jgi:hypothetical protein
MSNEPQPADTQPEAEAPTAEEAEAQRRADLEEATEARAEAEERAEQERLAMAEAATGHIGQPEVTDDTPRVADSQSEAAPTEAKTSKSSKAADTKSDK